MDIWSKIFVFMTVLLFVSMLCYAKWGNDKKVQEVKIDNSVKILTIEEIIHDQESTVRTYR